MNQRIDALTTADPYVNYSSGTEAISARLVALKAQQDQLTATVQGDTSAAALIGRRPVLARDLASEQIIQSDPVVQSLQTSNMGKTSRSSRTRARAIPMRSRAARSAQ